MATNTMAPIQMQAAGRKEGEPPCAISLPSLRMGFDTAEGADKAAAIEQWGSLAALKPGLFVDAQLRNPGTPASNADTPKAANSPPLPASGEEEDAQAAPQHEAQAFAPSKDAPGLSKENVPVKKEAPVQTPVDLATVAEHFAAVMAAEAAASAQAVQVERAMEPACRQEAERRESEERDAARKRKAEEMGLGELGADELLAAEILSGSFLSGLPHHPPPSIGAYGGKGRGGGGSRGGSGGGSGAREGKRARQASAKAAAASLLEVPLRVKAGGGGPRGRASGGSKQGLGKSSPSKPPASCAVASKAKMGGAGKPGASGLDEGAGVSASWVNKVVGFLESNGQDLLSSICAHYRIDFCGDVSSIRDYSLEQLAHNAIFNPALPKAAGRLPKMLRDIPGVSNWHMTFLKDQAGIYRAVRVASRLSGESLTVQCRCCSYCGSCFSGRFMKPNAMHQQAGGWKEITERTAAGKYSWSTLRGWRLCVPCFTHWASNGTNINANRPSVDDLIHEHKDLLASETVSDQALDPKALGFINTPVAAGSWQHQSALRSASHATTS